MLALFFFKLCHEKFSRFDRTPTCDGQKDGQTGRQTDRGSSIYHANIASSGNNLDHITTDIICPKYGKQTKTRMWANAKRDGRPAKYRYRHLFNAAKFG